MGVARVQSVMMLLPLMLPRSKDTIPITIHQKQENLFLSKISLSAKQDRFVDIVPAPK